MGKVLDCEQVFTSKKNYDKAVKILKKSKTYEVAVEVQTHKRSIKDAIESLLTNTDESDI